MNELVGAQLTSMSAADGAFLELLARESLDRAVDWSAELGAESLNVRLGPLVVRVETCGQGMAALALNPIRYAACDPSIEPDLRLILIDSSETGIEAPPILNLPISGPTGHWARQTFHEGQLEVRVDVQWRAWGICDRRRRLALIWAADSAGAPDWVINSHVRRVVHQHSYGQEWGIFHTAALECDGIGCLVTGRGGSGKSTLTAAAVENGLRTAGDDFVIIDFSHRALTAVPLLDTIKLDRLSLERFSSLAPFARNPTARYPNDKRRLSLMDFAPDSLSMRLPLHAALHARVSGKTESRITACSSAQVFRALVPSTMVLLGGEEQEIAAKARTLVSELPTFTFEIGINHQEAVSVLRRFLSELSR